MGLFDGYFDPEQFQASGGLLGRLLSLQQQQGQYQPGGDFDQAPSAPQAPTLLSMPSPMSQNYGQASGVPPAPAQDLRSQYAALLPILGDRNAMLATVNPEMGKALLAQTLVGQQKSGDVGGANSARYDQPVASDASPDPVRPGSQYAQIGPALCAAGPIPCAAGLGITAGQAILGGATLGLGALVLNNATNRPPPGSRPINETDWSGDHEEIKTAVGAANNDDVRISPEGEVWTKKPDGSWENHGSAKTYTGSGKPSGRRGKDRDRWN